MYRIGSSQHLPRIMRARERMRNFNFYKEYVGLRVKNQKKERIDFMHKIDSYFLYIFQILLF